MKKRILPVLLLVVSFQTIFAQLANPSFENWSTDTSILDLSLLQYPKDTFTFPDPNNWTSSNYITGADSLLATHLVTQSATAKTGMSSVSMKTDSLKAPFLGKVTLPGFVINGDFKIDIPSFLFGFDIAKIPGAGSPVTSRIEKIGGYLKYAPVMNDSCAVIAILKKNGVLVAQATYFHKTNDAAFTYFEAPFQYVSCDIPDTIVMLISSSNPYTVERLISGSATGLNAGSVLLADDMFYTPATAGFVVNPIARRDTTSTPNNVMKSVTVKANDEDCQTLALTISSATAALHGTAVVNGNNIDYTPDGMYIGKDSFTYTISNGSKTASARVVINVLGPNGINDFSAIGLNLYPNPASNFIGFSDANNIQKVTIKNSLGQTMATIENNFENIAVNTLATGLYFVEAITKENKIGVQKILINK